MISRYVYEWGVNPPTPLPCPKQEYIHAQLFATVMIPNLLTSQGFPLTQDDILEEVEFEGWQILHTVDAPKPIGEAGDFQQMCMVPKRARLRVHRLHGEDREYLIEHRPIGDETVKADDKGVLWVRTFTVTKMRSNLEPAR